MDREMKGWLHPAIPYHVVYKQGMIQSSAQGCLLRQYVREDMNLFRPDSGVHSNTALFTVNITRAGKQDQGFSAGKKITFPHST